LHTTIILTFTLNVLPRIPGAWWLHAQVRWFFIRVCFIFGLLCTVLCCASSALFCSAMRCDDVAYIIGDYSSRPVLTNTHFLFSYLFPFISIALSAHHWLSLTITKYHWLSRMSRISPLYCHYYHYIYINLKMRDIARCEHGGHHQRRQDNQALEHDDLGPGPLARAGKYWFKFWFRELLLYTGGVLFHVEWCIRHLCVFNHTQYYH